MRDVPLEVAVDDLALGGWDGRRIEDRCERLELKTVWGRLLPLLVDGSVGAPIPGGALDDSGGDGAGGRTARTACPATERRSPTDPATGPLRASRSTSRRCRGR